MTRTSTTAVMALLFAVSTTVPWMLASCATTESGDPAPTEPQAVPEAGGPDASADGEVPVDGGCDAADPECVTTPVTCEEAAWCPVPTNVGSLYALTAVWGSGKDDVWAAGSGGTVIHWDGAAWKETPLPSETSLPIKDTFHALWGSGPNDVWIASTSDAIFHTDGFRNGSTTWTRAPNPIERGRFLINTAWGTSAEDVRFGGIHLASFGPGGPPVRGNQIVKMPSDGGTAWAIAGVGGPAGGIGDLEITGLWGPSPDELWLIGDTSRSGPSQVGVSMHGKRHAGELVWSSVDTEAFVIFRGIWGSSASDVWMVGESGIIRHHGGGGGDGDWDVIESPTRKTLNAIWGSAANDVWAVGASGTILHWDGTRWEPSTAAFPVNKKRPHLYGVWGSGPSDVWIVGDGIALHHTGGGK